MSQLPVTRWSLCGSHPEYRGTGHGPAGAHLGERGPGAAVQVQAFRSGEVSVLVVIATENVDAPVHCDRGTTSTHGSHEGQHRPRAREGVEAFGRGEVVALPVGAL